jgi:DNA-binding GntR family transcriptional regulator
MAKKSKRARTKRPAPASPRAATPRHAVSSHQFHRPFWLVKILRERIVSGVYAPGARIREADLRAEFGFSNGPIREALQLIVADGLAERSPWQGVRVISLTAKQITELFEVRLALLEYAAELAASRASKEALDAAPILKKHIDDELKDIKSGKVHPSFQGELSRWLMTAAGNEKLHKLWTTTMLQTLIYVNAAMSRNAGTNLRPLMHGLVDSVVQGDRLAARLAARKLTQQTLRELGIEKLP